eukprot:Sdes_comp20692_c0_seq2m16260
MLVKRFFAPPHGSPPNSTASSPVVSPEISFQRIHIILAELIILIPAATSCLLPVLFEFFPYKRHSAEAHQNYIRNLLTVTCYVPALKCQIFELIIDKIIQIDVEIVLFPEEEDEEDEDLLESDSIQTHNSSDDAHQQGADEADTDDAQMEEFKIISLQMAEKLDSLMSLLFQYITNTYDPSKKNLNLKPNLKPSRMNSLECC